jgi:hypothetical protein
MDLASRNIYYTRALVANLAVAGLKVAICSARLKFRGEKGVVSLVKEFGAANRNIGLDLRRCRIHPQDLSQEEIMNHNRCLCERQHSMATHSNFRPEASCLSVDSLTPEP